MQKSLNMGQLAKMANVKIDTVRFYEKQRLIPEPPRTASGYRLFPPDTVHRLGFIARAKELGFTLDEIRELLSLRVSVATPCAEVQRRAAEKIADIQLRVQRLRQMEKALKRLSANCDNSNADCPLLEALGADFS